VSHRRRRKPSFLEALLAVFIAGVTLASMILTATLDLDFPDAVRLSAVGMAAVLSVYVLSVGLKLAHRRFPAAPRHAGKGHHKPVHVPRGLARRIDRRAGKKIRNHGAMLARLRGNCWDPNAPGKIDAAKWTRAQDEFIDEVLLDGVKPVLREAMKRRARLIGGWRRRIDAAVNEQDHARASAGHGVDFRPGMDGFEYEAYCARVLTEAGWKVWNKGDTGDQGVDLVAQRGDTVVAIQCKRYRGSVGNAAVQEIYAGRLTVGAEARAAVVTNAHYTRSAKELAAATHVLLLHHDELPQLAEIVAHGQSPAALREAA